MRDSNIMLATVLTWVYLYKWISQKQVQVLYIYIIFFLHCVIFLRQLSTFSPQIICTVMHTDILIICSSDYLLLLKVLIIVYK